MIDTYKIIKGVYDNQSTSILKSWSDVAQRDRGRGHNMRLYFQRSLKPVRQNAFGIRIVKIWNSLPEQVVNSPNVNKFKSRSDKHWENQKILYNYRSEIKMKQPKCWPHVNRMEFPIKSVQKIPPIPQLAYIMAWYTSIIIF